ncbi:MAG: hypothetical protein IPN38_16735 [Flavobacteriales bacterium]|nr:hypothetical protein [Flavobacteriales bacterium]
MDRKLAHGAPASRVPFAGGDNWLIGMLPTKKVLNIVPFVWYRGTDGYYRAARIVQDGVCHHISHHVLEQYEDRFKSHH